MGLIPSALVFLNVTLLSTPPQRGIGGREMNLVPVHLSEVILDSDTAPSSIKCDWGPSRDKASLTKP